MGASMTTAYAKRPRDFAYTLAFASDLPPAFMSENRGLSLAVLYMKDRTADGETWEL
jgi:hypothetical protein